LFLDGATFLVFSVTSNFFQSPVRPLMVALAKLVLPSALVMAAVSGPLKPPAALA